VEKTKQLDNILLQLNEVEQEVQMVKQLIRKKDNITEKQKFTLNKK